MSLHPDHPVYALLKQAAYGGEPTRQQLDDQLKRTDLPDGHDLNRHRAKIVAAVRDIYTSAHPSPHSHDTTMGLRLAERYSAELSTHFSGPEAEVRGDNPANRESISDITDRMFRRF
jgi:hypothetical protein